MFDNCKKVLKELHSLSNYGAPRFFTVLQFKMIRGDNMVSTDQEVTICFHIVSSCPGLKFLLKKALYKAVRYNSVTMSIKQYTYPQRDSKPENLSELEVKLFLNKKCSFCCSRGLLGPFQEHHWRDERSYLNSSLNFSVEDSISLSTRLFYNNEYNHHSFGTIKYNPLML